ncbi:MAG: efflux RND transporter periplasmic adaptor subunit [Methylotetracoccus sp.]
MKFSCRWLLIFGPLLSLAAPAADPEPAAPVVVNANAALLGKLTIVVVGQMELRDSLRVPARVELDQRRLAHIGATVSGRVVEIRHGLGDTVQRGDLLAVLNSGELATAQSDYLKAMSKLQLRRSAYTRAKHLHESGVLATANLQQRENELSEAEVDLNAATDHLIIMGMNDRDVGELARRRTIKSFSPITATLSGTIIERKITLGQVVQPSDAIFTVADLSHIWLVADISEQLAHWVREGDDAEAEIPALPGKRFSGRLIYVGDVIHPETRTAMIRMELPNDDGIVKPNMLAILLIRKLGSQQAVIPDEAVVREGNRDHVFVQTGPTQFRLQQVELGEQEGQVRPVLSGIAAGDRIVADGAFHLNNERMRKELE